MAEALPFAEAQAAAQQRRLERLSVAQRNEVRIFALRVLRDETYQRNLLQAARDRTIAPQIELALYHYGYGKPPDRLEIGNIGESEALESLSREELAERARSLAELLLKPAPPAPPEQPKAAEARSALDAVLAKRIAVANARLEAKPPRPEGLAPRLRELGELLEAEGALVEPEAAS